MIGGVEEGGAGSAKVTSHQTNHRFARCQLIAAADEELLLCTEVLLRQEALIVWTDVIDEWIR